MGTRCLRPTVSVSHSPPRTLVRTKQRCSSTESTCSGVRSGQRNHHFSTNATLRRSHDEVPDLLIGCVDTRAARKVIDQAVTRPMHATTYWLDIGNNAASGQYILGQPLNSRNRRSAVRLRTVSELYPEIVDAAAGEDPLPSCSAIEALDRQEPFINQTLASSALAMLARLFRYGKLNHHGAFFNAETGRMSALPIDPQMWTKVRRRNRRLRVAA